MLKWRFTLTFTWTEAIVTRRTGRILIEFRWSDREAIGQYIAERVAYREQRILNS